MRLRIIPSSEAAPQLSAMRARAEETRAEIALAAEEILRGVRTGGYEAVCAYSERFDRAVP